MEPIGIFGVALGIHILIARIYLGVKSKFPNYYLLGGIEGIPIILTGIILQNKITWTLILFLLADCIYIGGSILKRKIDEHNEKYSLEKWGVWLQEKSKISQLLRIILFIS